MPVFDEDRYHGKILTRDDHALWVYRRLHRGSGWCVEVHEGEPDGTILDRSWHSSGAGAAAFVHAARNHLARQALTSVDGQIIDPPEDRGVVVAHGFKGRGSPSVRVGDDAAQLVCVVFWLPPGTHTLSWLNNLGGLVCERTVSVETHSALHAYGTEMHRLVPKLPAALPFWHRCRARRIAFDGAMAPTELLTPSPDPRIF